MFDMSPDQFRATPKKGDVGSWRVLSWSTAVTFTVGLLFILPSWSARDFREITLPESFPIVQESAATKVAAAKYVILVSIDGLRPDAITSIGRERLPNLYRFRAEGAWTDNARTDRDYTLTLPNHTTMLTGRGVVGNNGHNWNTNSDPSPNETLHSNHGSYIASIFDVAHDHGLRTGAYVSKSKFVIFDQSYSGSSGAEDVTGPDNGRDKIDIYRYDSDSEDLVDDFILAMQTAPLHLSFLHLHDPDSHGHGTGWMRSNYLYAVQEMDGLLGRLFDFVENDEQFRDNTVVIVTSDHGGTGYGHNDSSVAEHYIIPFYVWGTGVTRGVDLYTLNANSRRDPQFSRTTYATFLQPIRNGDAANLALSLLGLGNVPGSMINTDEQLSVDGMGTQLPLARFTVTPTSGNGPLLVRFDASASTDVDGVIVSHDWDFGDGNSGSGEMVNHTYSDFGRYTVSLSVTDDFGATAFAMQTVTVKDPNSVTVSFQDGAEPTSGYNGTRDTKIRANSEEEFFGSDTEIEVDGDSDKAGLLKWDLSSIPSQSTILSADIILEIIDASSDTYEVYEVEQDWVEGETNWLQYRNGSMWQIEGANGVDDRGSDVLGTFYASVTGSDTIGLGQAALTLIKGWVDNPSSNYGFILLDYDDNSYNGIDFYSRETASANHRPKLTITYTPPHVDSTQIQFIHNLPFSVPVDLWFDEMKIRENLEFRSATGYDIYAAGDHEARIQMVGTPAEQAIVIPLRSLVKDQNYAVIAHGSLANPMVKILETRLMSLMDNMVDVLLVHGSTDLGMVDVRILDPADNATPTKVLANDFSFDAATDYLSLEPGSHNVQVTNQDNSEEIETYYVDLGGYQGQTVILNLSGSRQDLGLLGVSVSGGVFLSQVATGIAEDVGELPAEFTLHGNYPNPFNPSTRIQFDLPETARVSLQVVNMLGREVLTLPAKEYEAGANQTLELNTINLASGTYVYRIIATSAGGQYVKMGRMTLVK